MEDHHYCSIAPSDDNKEFKSYNNKSEVVPVGRSSALNLKPISTATSITTCIAAKSDSPVPFKDKSRKTVDSSKSVVSNRISKAKQTLTASTNHQATINNSSTVQQIGNDCFKRFFLQRQLDGTFVIVPFGSTAFCPSSKPSILKTVPLTTTVANSTTVSIITTSCGNTKSQNDLDYKSPVIILNENSMKINQSTELAIKIEPTFNQIASMADSNVTMSTLVNKPSHYGPLRSLNVDTPHHHLQSATTHIAQNRNIHALSKPDYFATSVMTEMTSPPPIVTSSTQKLPIEESNTFENGSKYQLQMQNQPNNLFEQNMLPPVETIFPGDRHLMNEGFFATLQQLQSEMITDKMVGQQTTIINDHHIDYYNKGKKFF